MAAVEPAPVKLAPPGAGLPLIERVLTRLLAPIRARKTPWEATRRHFERQTRRIHDLAAGLTQEQLSRQVLIPRMPGLEDSSRYWSVAMALEHLAITIRGMTEIVCLLSNGNDPAFEVDTAQVKPKGKLEAAEALAAFDQVVAQSQARFDHDVGDRASRRTHFHPWMGHITPHQWHWLNASHVSIHLRQIEAIVQRL